MRTSHKRSKSAKNNLDNLFELAEEIATESNFEGRSSIASNKPLTRQRESLQELQVNVNSS